MSEESRACGLVLVVEDNELIREALQAAIESEGYSVRTANNGEEALLILQETKEPCLILTDLLMPRMNGYEFIELVSKTHKIAAIPIVVLSAAPMESKMKTMTDSGKIKGSVKKPVNLDALFSIIHEHCGKPPAYQDIKKIVNESFTGIRNVVQV